MNNLDAERIRLLARGPVQKCLTQVEVFAEIESTNSYLMKMPAPDAGKLRVAVTCNQTAGRGRHGRVWQSPPGSGLCMSAAYTFARPPAHLAALSLALGLGAIDALEALGASGVTLKWPNDVVALDGKLAGILTEVRQASAGTLAVVAGIGVNVDLTGEHCLGIETKWAQAVVDLKSICDVQPSHEDIAVQFIVDWFRAFVDYDTSGCAAMVDRWCRYDWLRGRTITVDTADEQISGLGAGIAADGALLVDTPDSGICRVTSGTIVKADSSGERR